MQRQAVGHEECGLVAMGSSCGDGDSGAWVLDRAPADVVKEHWRHTRGGALAGQTSWTSAHGLAHEVGERCSGSAVIAAAALP